jgi:hypothetical protein
MPPTGPAAMNGSQNHSRASSTASNYRPGQPPVHSARPSMSGQAQFGMHPAQSPRMLGQNLNSNGRNSPSFVVDYPLDGPNVCFGFKYANIN